MTGLEFSLMHLCTTYLHRHPKECQALDIYDLVQLAAYHERLRDEMPEGAMLTATLPEVI